MIRSCIPLFVSLTLVLGMPFHTTPSGDDLVGRRVVISVQEAVSFRSSPPVIGRPEQIGAGNRFVRPPEPNADFDQATRLDPSDADSRNSLAWLLATSAEDSLRDGGRAVSLATRVCELTAWQDVYKLGTLAAAHAEAVDFGRAIDMQEKVNALCTNDQDREKGDRRLAMYREGKPYREDE